MKIAVKKKYIVCAAGIICGGLGWIFLVEIWKYVSHESITILIAPSVFLASLIYIVYFWINLRFKNKLAEEVGKESSPNDPHKAREIREHLFNKTFEEAYTVNIFKGRIKLTSSWTEQQEIDKILSTHIQKVVKDELLESALKKGN